MADLWVYRVDVLVMDGDDEPDITSYEVVTSDDEKIGKVEDATEEAGRAWIVVDTGFWIFGKKRMIPAGAIESIDPESREVRVSLTKDEIKKAPDYDEVRRHEAFYQGELEDYYRQHKSATGS
ncbi:MAG: hypothetical protein JWM85_760 [Acidimicrobiaceae bacterium]|nr:hypothetical protein [Acidimicrobiaceae bacterium]